MTSSAGSAISDVGAQLRGWRRRRRLTQLDLSLRSDVSARHLSFVETGRSRPTAEMIVRLAEALDVPLRGRNQLLLAGGYAPAYPEHDLADAELYEVTNALRAILEAHAPHPALLIDRCWDVVEANDAASLLLTGCAPELLEPPLNVCRICLHPDGLAPQLRNLGQWRSRLLAQVRHRAESTGDGRLDLLLADLRSYPGDRPEQPDAHPDARVVMPLELRLDGVELSFFSLTTSVETPQDVTVAELSIEAFYPADAATVAWINRSAYVDVALPTR